MTDGTSAGLVSAGQVVAEAAAKRAAEAARIAAMDAGGEAGCGASTVFRDRTGRAVSLEEAQRLKAEEAAAKKGPVREAPEWAGGLAQRRAAAEEQRALRAEGAAPFARRADDMEMNERARRASRWGDPLALETAPAAEPAPLPLPGGDAALLARAGFRIPLEVPAHSWLRRKLGAPINRYGIKPGRHWDGVDRGTGFEEQYFKAQNERATRERDAAGTWSE